MAIYGYIRVSSAKQTVEHQRYEIKQFARNNNFTINQWIQETISSRKPLRKRKLGLLLDSLQADDVLIACEISRLGRSLLEVMHILEVCLNKDCRVCTIKENYHLGNDIQSKVMAFAFGLAAEIERQLISQRTKSSLASIRAGGKKLGRPPKDGSQRFILEQNTHRIRRFLKQGLSKSQIARTLSVNRTTLRHFMLEARMI